MDLRHLRCFLAVADQMHFGRAAQQLNMLPAALGRNIKLLEQELRVKLFHRTTRNAALTEAGLSLLEDARVLVALSDAVAARLRSLGRARAEVLRIGAIDSAAAGLVPLLLHDFQAAYPSVAVELVEDKSIRLLPQLVSGRIDLAFIRPLDTPLSELEVLPLLHETAVVALPHASPLACLEKVCVDDLLEEPLIIPARRSRPHSHDLTMKLFADAGLRPRIAQRADEKQTIVNLVSAGLGSAIVPRWTSRMAIDGVIYRPLELGSEAATRRLPLAAAWLRGSRDPTRDALLGVLHDNLAGYSREA